MGMKKDYILPNIKEARRRNNTEEIARLTYNVDEKYLNLGKDKKYLIKTHGCQANFRDSETIAGLLEELGFIETTSEEDADIVLINTCAIREGAEDKVFGEVGALKRLKRERPEMLIGICGCMAQEEKTVTTLLEKYHQVDIIFGTHNIISLPKMIYDIYNANKKRAVEVFSKQGEVIENVPVTRLSSHKASVNIMYGCDKFCTYCIVPYTRGRERSRYKEDIIQEVIDFKNAGGKEVILLGQNVNAYGKDLGEKDGFTDLLSACAETGIERIRFYTSHPRDYSVTTIEAMKKYPNIMKSLHLPVQSGSNEILKKMNRGYTVESYKALFDDMKNRIPEITFTTDLIVGFPGETEEQFKQTLDLVDYCKYDLAYSFVFSPRAGTPAAKMEDNISLQEKKERLHILNEHIGMHANENNQKYVGKVLKVLCEGPSKKNKDVLTGYSEENKLVNFTGKGVLAGDIVRVKIINAKSYSLDGELVKE